MYSSPNSALSYRGAERRTLPRKFIPSTITARSTDHSGNNMEVEAALLNINEQGLYMRIPHCVEPGTKLDLYIGFYAGEENKAVGVHLRAEGIVLRAQAQMEDGCDTAVLFTRPLPLDLMTH